MADREEGKEFGLEEAVEWVTIVLEKGDVVEVYIPRTNLTIQVDAWCSFVVLATSTQSDGSLVAEVRFLGCIDQEVSKLLEEEMNGRGRRGLLYFCPSQPCTEVVGDPFAIHVLRFRLWTMDGYKAVFFDAKLRTRVRQWLRREKDPDLGEDETPEGADVSELKMKKPAAAVAPRREKGAPKAGATKAPKAAPKSDGRHLTASMRSKLRKRLEEVKSRTGKTRAGEQEEEDFSEGPVPTTPPSEAEDSDCVLEELPTTGSRLEPRPPSLALAVAEGGKKKKKKEKEKKKKKKKKEGKEKDVERADPHGLEVARVEAPPAAGGTRGISLKDLRGQLVKRAVITDRMKSQEKKTKRGKKDAAKRLREALTEVLSPKEAKKKKKKETKRKKRRILADGVIESLSTSSTNSSEEEDEISESSFEDLETPMKQRSRDKPGSVLRMLTQHVQEQLEQAATTEVSSGQDSLTGGVKILTYFALQIKPSYPTQLREMREMFHLANVMDALRRGEIAKVGDALAARFMAIHQSLIDQNWSTARFMEIFPLEEPSAASSSLVLAKETHQAGSQSPRHIDKRMVRLFSRSWQRWKGRMVWPWRCKRRWEGSERKREERKRQGKRKGQERRPERMEGEEREAGGEVRKGGGTLEGLAHALPSPGTEHWEEKASFEAAAHASTDLRKLGCAVAWFLARNSNVSPTSLQSKMFASIFSSEVWHRAVSRHMALPIRKGELWKIHDALMRVPFEDVFRSDFIDEWSHQSWLLNACYAVNSLYGCVRPLADGGWNKAEKRVVKAIGEGVKRLLCHGTAETAFDPGLEKELRSKRINYQGEEVGICHKLTLEQVLPSLPPPEHGGAIDICEFVSPHTKHLLLNPGKCILDDVGQELPKLQGRVHVETGHIDAIADELVKRNVCGWIPFSSVFRFRGTPILNGLFGVGKNAMIDSHRSVLRLIMNLVPSNSIMRAFVGSVKNLPSITQWMTTVLEEGEELRIWQSDMCNAFYLFR